MTPAKVTEVKRLSPHAVPATDAHRRQVERVKASLVACPPAGPGRGGAPRGK
jgi:hypothetical protein